MADEHSTLTGWQPIKTAPKDFTVIMLHEPGKLSGRVHGHHLIGHWEPSRFYVAGGYWKGDDGSVVQATHWMPLPDPPKEHGRG